MDMTCPECRMTAICDNEIVKGRCKYCGAGIIFDDRKEYGEMEDVKLGGSQECPACKTLNPAGLTLPFECVKCADVTLSAEVRTPDEWAEEMDFEILDPDGWRWKCGELEPRPYSEEISRKEFNVRAIYSTIRPREQQSNSGAVAHGKDGKVEDFETWWREEIDKCLMPPTPERMAKLAWGAALKSKIPCLALEIVNHAAMMGCKCQSTGPDVEENRHWQSCIVGKAQTYLGRKVSRQGGE